MTQKRSGPAANETAPNTTNQADTQKRTGPADISAISSQQVSWWSVHLFIEAILERVQAWPTAGTPEWRDLPDSDARKLAAVLDGGQHHALRMEMAQEARCQASQVISAAADWAAIGREIRQRGEFYRERPWLRRRSA